MNKKAIGGNNRNMSESAISMLLSTEKVLIQVNVQPRQMHFTDHYHKYYRLKA